MSFNVFSYTDRGGRDYNEDFCGHWQQIRQGVLQGAYILCDGLGGHGHGETASKLAVGYVLDKLAADFDISDDKLIELINSANAAVIDKQTADPEVYGMRTTLAGAVLSGTTFKYFNVGDSRVYYFRENRIIAQTKDHSVPQMAVELGEITPDQVRYSEDRSKLLKVLGDNDNLNIKKIEPAIEVLPGDAFIICTDGFWEFVLEAEMEQTLCKCGGSPEQWCALMCGYLVSRITGSNDNNTAICAIAV